MNIIRDLKHRIPSILAAAATAWAMLCLKAYAQLSAPPSIDGLADGADAESLKEAILSVLLAVLDFVSLLAVVFIVIAGIRLVVSGGDEGEKDKAKKTIVYVIAGLIVIIFARVIVAFVLDVVGNS